MPDDIRDKSQGKFELYQNISLYSADLIISKQFPADFVVWWSRRRAKWEKTWRFVTVLNITWQKT